MNFIEEFKKGQEARNTGLYMGDGLYNLGKVINQIQKGRIYGFAASPKVGKTTVVDYAFLINAYLDSLKKGIDLHIKYYSFEISRVEKEFNIAVYFMYNDYNIEYIKLDEGITHKGLNIIPLSPDYLLGRLLDDNENVIKVKENIKNILIGVYNKYILPMFGEYNKYGKQIKTGVIDFIEEKNNPTGIYKEWIKFAEKRGKFITVPTINNKSRITGYNPDNPGEQVIIITDHLRKLIRERGFSLKETIDKYIEYSVDIKRWCKYTFAHIIHLNRSMTDESRIRHAGKMLYPNSDDVKDTGNLSEEADYMFTMFNPNDERYRLKEHFDLKIRNNNNLLYPNLRTLHLVESRHTFYPQHFRTIMLGNLKTFKKF